jgi:hypothetical protein
MSLSSLRPGLRTTPRHRARPGHPSCGEMQPWVTPMRLGYLGLGHADFEPLHAAEQVILIWKQVIYLSYMRPEPEGSRCQH